MGQCCDAYTEERYGENYEDASQDGKSKIRLPGRKASSGLGIAKYPNSNVMRPNNGSIKYNSNSSGNNRQNSKRQSSELQKKLSMRNNSSKLIKEEDEDAGKKYQTYNSAFDAINSAHQSMYEKKDSGGSIPALPS